MSESEESVREGRTLRSGKFVAFAVETEEIQIEMSEEETDSEVKSVEELQAQVDELQQKLTMAESAIDDRDGELRAAQDALKRAKEDAESDLRRIDKEKKELISKHEKTLGELEDTVSRQDETIKTLEDHLAECKQLLEKQEVQLELARLQAMETLREKFDKERETYLDRIQRLEKELESARRKAVGPSTTSPKEPETRKRDDAATSRKGELKESGVGSREKGGKKASGKEGKGDPLVAGSTSGEHARVVGKSGEKEADLVVAVPSSGGAVAADKHAVGSLSEDESEKGDKVKTTDSSMLSASDSSDSATVPMADPHETELVQSVAKFIQAQTDMMAAQTKVMAAQSLPPLPHFSGEGNLVGEDSFERWVEHFEERAAVAGWTGEEKKYRLKMHLDKTAFQTYCNLPKETQGTYSDVISALRKRFQPVDIEELRGAEFYQMTQTTETVEEMGIKLQTTARKAFPSLVGKEWDRLLKGRFFHCLATKWQRKLDAPKPKETFEELYARARTLECHDQQFSQSAANKNEPRNKKKSSDKDSSEPAGQSAAGKATNTPSEGAGQKQSRSDVCFYCGKHGHIAKYCFKKGRKGGGAEATGRSSMPNKVLSTVTDMTDQQLEQELASRRLNREQALLTDPEPSDGGKVNVVKGAVGPTLMLELFVEGLQAAAVVDTASNSTIISRPMLHSIKRHLESLGKPIPKLELPCMPLYGKEGTKGKPLDITAQVMLTFSCDGRKVTVPTFIQPESEQHCLIGMNVIPFLGITVRRANGKPLHAVAEQVAQVRLIQTTTIPGQKGRVVEVQVESDGCVGDQLLFEPEHQKLSELGIWAQESLIAVQPSGKALLPIQNFQGISVKLTEGEQLGVASLCDLPRSEEPESNPEPTLGFAPQGQRDSTCACVNALPNTPERYATLMKVLDLPDDVNPSEMKEFNELMKKSTDIFALDDSELGCTNVTSHRIDTGDHQPIKQMPYRTPIIYRDKITQMVNEMEKRGIVRPSSSPWASPVVLVPKKDGSLRFCVDFRRLNSITQKDVYPLPRVDDILDTLGNARFFTTLDLASGYWQVPLDDDTIPKTAFTTHKGLYEFVRMPFGLCNAPATFQRAMQSVLAGLEWRDCFVYIDDILIASATFEEHLQHLEQVFNRLRTANLRLKPKKCRFLCKEVKYLGHVISVHGVLPDPEKTNQVKSFPTPTDVTSVRRFLGLASYYRRFVPKFAKIAAPLHALLKKENVFEWTTECTTAFNLLKDALTSSLILVYPKFGPDSEFILETDASYVGLGAVLSQQQEDGKAHPIAYASRSLNVHEKKYGVTELETLGLVWAVRYFRPYLLGHKTTVFTDHSACLSLLNHPRPSGKLARWALTIQEMDLLIKHRPGKSNTNADALSRHPVPQRAASENAGVPSPSDDCNESLPCIGTPQPSKCISRQSPNISVCSVNSKNENENDEIKMKNDEKKKNEIILNPKGIISDCNCMQKASREIRELQLKDTTLTPYFQYLEEHKLPTSETESRRIVLECEKLEVIDGILHHDNPVDSSQWCVVVPSDLRPLLLSEAHSSIFSGHFSERKIYERLRRQYWWRGMRADVRRFCRACITCASRKGPGRAVRPPLNPIPVKKPFHRIAVDVLTMPLTSRGNRYIVVFMDYFSKWAEAFAVPDQQAPTIARLLVDNIICRHGVPEELLSDRGSNFLSDLMMEICRILGIKKLNTSGYHPQTDGLVEKFNSTLLGMMSKCSDSKTLEWDQQLPTLLFAYRSMVQESTKESPFFLLYGRDPRLPTESVLGTTNAAYLVDMEDYRSEFLLSLAKAQKLALENIRKAQSKQKEFYDRASENPKYRIGDRVMTYMPGDITGKDWKLARPYHGPYRIISLTPTNAEVQLIERPSDPTLFVAISRLRRCYPEIPSDVSWTGRHKKAKRKRRSGRVQENSNSQLQNLPRREGPVTRSMARAAKTGTSSD